MTYGWGRVVIRIAGPVVYAGVLEEIALATSSPDPEDFPTSARSWSSEPLTPDALHSRRA